MSLDRLARKVGSSKRMLVHYFGGREKIEQQAITRLEDRLRAQFVPEAFPPGTTAEAVVSALWERTTVAQSRGVLLLVMDLSKRAWSGRNAQSDFTRSSKGCGLSSSCDICPIARPSKKCCRRSRERSWRSWSPEIASRGGGRCCESLKAERRCGRTSD